MDVRGRTSDGVGGGHDRRECRPHSHANTGPPEHFDVIDEVANGKCLCNIDIKAGHLLLPREAFDLPQQ